jgi:D-alanine-D-alanine ligase
MARRRSKNRDILILYGKLPPDASEDEKDMLMEVRSVSKALKTLGRRPIPTPVSFNLHPLEALLGKHRNALVFNLVETMKGSCRFLAVVPSLLEHLGHRFTGSSSETLYVTTNKPLSKSIMALHGIPTPAWQTCEEALEHGVSFKPPYILKSIWEHASIGLNEDSVQFSEQGLMKTMRNMGAKAYSGFFIERYIEGREFNISLIAGKQGLEVLPPAEVTFDGFGSKPKIVDYRAKWDPSSRQFHNTNRSFKLRKSDSGLLQSIRHLTLECGRVFALQGYARVDFRVDEKGIPSVLEVNANHCISPDSGFAAACAQYGMTYPDTIQRILGAAGLSP